MTNEGDGSTIVVIEKVSNSRVGLSEKPPGGCPSEGRVFDKLDNDVETFCVCFKKHSRFSLAVLDKNKTYKPVKCHSSQRTPGLIT